MLIPFLISVTEQLKGKRIYPRFGVHSSLWQRSPASGVSSCPWQQENEAACSHHGQQTRRKLRSKLGSGHDPQSLCPLQITHFLQLVSLPEVPQTPTTVLLARYQVFKHAEEGISLDAGSWATDVWGFSTFHSIFL